ncbi:hypothetical protein A2U01_0114465, partial [Trifolium medium]|nr:hypothetical protein [Trifolium medium]
VVAEDCCSVLFMAFSWWGKTCEAVIDTRSSSIGPLGAAD